MQILVIIDMQEVFPAANDKKTIEAVIDLVQEFKRKNLPIFIVEYAHHGPTLDPILRALGSYKNQFFMSKILDDGSWEIVRERKFLKLEDYKDFILCGVNTNFCVKDTAKGLYTLLYDEDITVRLVRRATNFQRCLKVFEGGKRGFEHKRDGYGWVHKTRINGQKIKLV